VPLRAYARGRIAHLLEFGNIGPLPWPKNRYQPPLRTVCLGLGLYRKGEIGPSCCDALVEDPARQLRERCLGAEAP
jgi:hypothetical protein